MEKKSETKKANLEALPKFLLILLASAVVGGCVGYFGAKYGIDSLTGRLAWAGDYFAENIAHWLLLALAVLLPAVCVPLYLSAKKTVKVWDGEDEAVSDRAEGKLSLAIAISSCLLIVAFFLICAAYSGGFEAFENPLTIPVSIAAFLAAMVEAVILQQCCVDMAKRLSPEKMGSVYDMKFQKKWLESCDEAEKAMIGRCALKAYSAVNTACSTLVIVLALAALFFGVSFLAALAVCVIWLTNTIAYMRESIKLSKAGNKLS